MRFSKKKQNLLFLANIKTMSDQTQNMCLWRSLWCLKMDMNRRNNRITNLCMIKTYRLGYSTQSRMRLCARHQFILDTHTLRFHVKRRINWNKPVFLPSGHWVDNTTVEKWRKENLIWSKDLTDPFTGQTILPTSLSVSHVKQKEIADYFLSYSWATRLGRFGREAFTRPS